MEIGRLDAHTLLADRPFTHPDRSRDDLRILLRSVAAIRTALAGAPPPDDNPMAMFNWQSDAGAPCRLYVRRGVALAELPLLWLVGFFGTRRENAGRSHMDRIDDALIEEMAHRHLHIVCYCTALLEDGQFGNLVLSTSDDARLLWNSAPLHAQAVRDDAPPFYRSVRLHNGHFAAGLLDPNGPALTVTKYLDYGESGQAGIPPWRAWRVWEPPLRVGG